METKEKNTATPYDLDGKPPLKLAIPLGLQHVLAMFVGKIDEKLVNPFVPCFSAMITTRTTVPTKRFSREP